VIKYITSKKQSNDGKGKSEINTPLVSISLGAYNGEKYIAAQLDSIIEQTYPNIEIVVTDDCSTDNTPQILKNYAEKYDNIKVYFNEINLGLIGNYEKNLKLVQGEYIAFADQDDIWLPDKIELLMNNIGNFPLIYADSAYIDGNGNLMNKKISDFRNLVSGKNLYIFEPTGGAWIAAHAMLFHRNLLDIAFPFSNVNHDHWFAFIAMLKGGVKYFPQVLTLYRQHGSNSVGGLGCEKIMTEKQKTSKKEQAEKYIREVEGFLSLVPENEPEFRLFLTKLRNYSANPTFANRIRRMLLRLKYLNKIYAPRKRNTFRRAFKVLKLF
jgi:glycosyltransferase involved in cell wall biosynthesis